MTLLILVPRLLQGQCRSGKTPLQRPGYETIVEVKPNLLLARVTQYVAHHFTDTCVCEWSAGSGEVCQPFELQPIHRSPSFESGISIKPTYLTAANCFMTGSCFSVSVIALRMCVLQLVTCADSSQRPPILCSEAFFHCY